MTLAAPPVEITPEDLLRLPDAVKYELVGGTLVERHMGMDSSRIGIKIAVRLSIFLEKNDAAGEIFGSDAGYQCFPDAPRKVRRPDVSFIRSGRLPGDQASEGHCRIAPDLAVEVISPGDLFYEVEAKVDEYLRAGVPLVWVISPPSGTVQIYRPQSAILGRGTVLNSTDTITGEDVLPGFTCLVSDFFT